MSGIGDSGGGIGDEEAAWQDLVARFDLPADTTAAPPWPAREDLADTPSGRPRPEQDTAVRRDPSRPPAAGGTGQAGLPGPAGRAGAAGLPGSVRGPGEDDDDAGPPAVPPPEAGLFGPDPFGPAFFGSDPFGIAPAAPSPDALSPDALSPEALAPGTPFPGDAPADPAAAGELPAAGDAGTREAPPARPARGGKHASRSPGDRARIVRRAGPVPPPALPGDDAEDDGRYVPPFPEPLPQLDPVTKGAWAGLLGGPAYLVVASLIGHLSGFGALIAIVAFIGGGLTLFLRMSDRPRDDDDDGAVV